MATQSKLPGIALSASEQKDLSALRHQLQDRCDNLIKRLEATQETLVTTRRSLGTIMAICSRSGVEAEKAETKGGG